MSRGYAAIGFVGTKCAPNFGAILRAAHCYGCDLILLDAPRFIQSAQDVTKASRHIPMIVGDIAITRPHDCPMVAVEIHPKATPLPSFVHPTRCLYVFGPEDGSLPNRILEHAQLLVSIPTAYCMNLAATANVVLYDRMVKTMGGK
jgi:tRNA(Leu) C34 or U34 (ribose-2'-O)-methylase TrmL